MIVTIHPSGISGIIQAPASKSSMQRACAAALLHFGKTVIHYPGHSNDDKAAIGLIQQMGALVNAEENKLVITSKGVQPFSNQVNCGESGLGIRMFAPILSLSEMEITIYGEGSLLTRPMDFFDEVFPQLGIEISSNKGKLPLRVKGPLQPRNIEIDGSLSSQFLTGLLMAYSAAGAKDVSIKVKNLKSRPYIDLTLDVMKRFCFNVPENKNYEEFYFPGFDYAQQKSLDPSTSFRTSLRTYTVEGDWSGGAFLLVAGAIAGNIVIEGLDISSTQADKAVLTALQQTGASLSIQSNRIEIGPAQGRLKAFHFDATECPDLFPPLVALAAYCEGKTVIEGAKRLTHKESNRAITLQNEFKKMGIDIDLQDDLMIVQGGTGVKGHAVHSHHDHRIAMACAVAALKADGETSIGEAQAINKSYPDFYLHIQQLGASLVLPQSSGNKITQ
ncbi:MAG: 3-phosphoshikimate 1-carboxyvinyltransferase [Chitinophagaceae bacterium]|nr:3-phosphoshikimate 1-carboxyvinyltransferase [Chitinophagaceae bacterium]